MPAYLDGATIVLPSGKRIDSVEIVGLDIDGRAWLCHTKFGADQRDFVYPLDDASGGLSPAEMAAIADLMAVAWEDWAKGIRGAL